MNQLFAMQCFLRLVETESFTRAAESLAIPRSTISKQIADLEQHLEVRLLHRTTRSLHITNEGLTYYDRISGLVHDIQDADNDLRNAKLKPSGALRIDLPASYARELLVPALPDFRRLYPDVQISLGISDRVIDMVGEGVDCAIRAGVLHDTSVVARRLKPLAYATGASPLYLDEYGRPEHPGELAERHHIVGYFSTTTERPEPLIFEKGSERLEVSQRTTSTNDGQGLVSMMRAGLGIGQHFSTFMEPLVAKGELEFILQEWSRPPVEMNLVYPPHKHQTARLRAFIEWTLANFG